MTTRLDAHQHFWKYSPAEYGWIGDNMASLRRDFLPHDLQPLLAEQGFAGSIAVQARQSLEETRWLLELAAHNDVVKGVVGWVDLRSPDLSAQLHQFAQNPSLVGVRHVVQDEPDNDFMLGAEFRRGIARLGEYDLAYDILIYPRQLPAAIKLVRDLPEQRFVLDHIAKPPIAEGRLNPWNRDLRELGKSENVFCKLSGMVTEARWNDWKPQDFRPYLDVVLDTFTPARLMVGSDWPVCTASASYRRTIALVRDYIGALTSAEQDLILGENCARFYRIREPNQPTLAGRA
ncbi:amidohydrolase family protein [Occallatibacter savannae]|uniref:amidohydrolase family protein n=1 Tax=Occallatibacter savannae TaxID=1002691 RepID=UPI000D6931A9|nr:amidohydrolase family protein [Occallatibacter savannae]